MKLIVGYVLEWMFQKASSLLLAFIAKVKRQKQIDEQAKESTKPLKDAVTGEEIDAAAKETLSGL